MLEVFEKDLENTNIKQTNNTITEIKIHSVVEITEPGHKKNTKEKKKKERERKDSLRDT